MSQSGVAERVGQWQYRAWKMPVAVVTGGQRVYFIHLFIQLFIYLIEPDGVRDVKKKPGTHGTGTPNGTKRVRSGLH
jgi:hypothetical protein